MYAVIRTGGKQYRVEEGDTLEVELLGDVGSTLEVEPVMVVDGDAVQATPSQLDGASVAVEVDRRGEGTQDQRVHLQVEVEPASSLGPPPALSHHHGHLDLEGQGLIHVEDQGWRLDPQRA